MRKALYILSEFKDQDIDWIVGAGHKENIPAGDYLVTQGQPIEALWIILAGRFSVTADPGGELALLGAGEIVGELSFLDSRPPTASVKAVEDSVVLSILRSRLKSKLKADTAFAARFFRAIGVLLADRMRSTVAHLAFGSSRNLDKGVESEGEISPELMDGLSLAASRFEEILRKMLD